MKTSSSAQYLVKGIPRYFHQVSINIENFHSKQTKTYQAHSESREDRFHLVNPVYSLKPLKTLDSFSTVILEQFSYTNPPPQL